MTIDFKINSGVAEVTINRPEKKNAVTLPMREQIWDAFEACQEDDSVRAILFNSIGDDFCSGMDVGEMGGGGVPGSLMRMRRLHHLIRSIAHTPKPVICAVRGFCVGAGWSMALATDFVVASQTSRFSQIFRKIALAPDAGAVWFLSRSLGVVKAKELVYSGKILTGEEAAALGLVKECVPDNELDARARALAEDLAAAPTIAIGMAKRQFDMAQNLSLDDFLEFESGHQPLAARTEDHAEGIAAFRERRATNFKGL